MAVKRPTLIHFRPPLNTIPINNQHVQFHKILKANQENFNVIVIDHSCNYNEILDKYNPDIAVFQLWAESITDISIEGVKNNNTIPKIGLAIFDMSSPVRGSFYRLMESFGIENILASGVSVAETFPEIANQIINYPHFIDSDINYDYRLNKSIPILLTGYFEDRKKFYDWRSKVKKPILDNFPALYFRHPGYNPETAIPEMLRIHGEKYFKLLNESWIVPTCGSFNNTLLMKHLEIPGAKSCLICDKNPTVELFGFNDMLNCVFSEPSEIIDKLNFLFSNLDKLKQIIENGYELVHSKHTQKQRPHLFQWYNLLKIKTASQKIIQLNPFGNLELVETENPKETFHFKVSEDVKWIKSVDTEIHNKRFTQAEEKCKFTLDHADYIYDAILRLYFINMLNKRTLYAFYNLRQLIAYSVSIDIVPDPLEFSLFILHLLVEKKVEKAVYYSKIAITKRRKELDYARLLAFRIGKQNNFFYELKSEIQSSNNRSDLKTMYYFYSDEFNLLETLEVIVKKNIINHNYTYEELIKLPVDVAYKKIKLNEIEEEFDCETLKVDLESLKRPVSVFHKAHRKTQLFLNKAFKFQ